MTLGLCLSYDASVLFFSQTRYYRKQRELGIGTTSTMYVLSFIVPPTETRRRTKKNWQSQFTTSPLYHSIYRLMFWSMIVEGLTSPIAYYDDDIDHYSPRNRIK